MNEKIDHREAWEALCRGEVLRGETKFGIELLFRLSGKETWTKAEADDFFSCDFFRIVPQEKPAPLAANKTLRREILGEIVEALRSAARNGTLFMDELARRAAK
jgi:hypothetical protein